MKLFAVYMERNYALLPKTQNEVNLLTDFNFAYIFTECVDLETVHFDEYMRPNCVYSPDVQNYLKFEYINEL
jgi:hypothetical protein